MARYKTKARPKSEGDPLVFRTYACDSGGEAEEHTFELLQKRSEGPPNFCPRCGARVDIEGPLPAKISIGGSNAARAADMTYNLVEQSSIARAEMAEEAGLSPAQARSLKVTDMHDNLREGDVAAKLPPPPNNPVGQFMQQAKAAGINYGFMQGNAPGQGTYNGPTTDLDGRGKYSGPTNLALGALQGDDGTVNQQTRAQMIAAGRINKGG